MRARPTPIVIAIAALVAASGCLEESSPGALSGATPDSDAGNADAASDAADADTASDTASPDATPDAASPDVGGGPCGDAWTLVLEGDISPSAVTTLPDGDAVVVGRFSGELALGAHSLWSQKETAFAARFDSETCEVAWLVELGVATAPVDVAVGAAGAPLVVAATRSPDGFAISGHVLYLTPATGAVEDDVTIEAVDVGFGAAVRPRAVSVASGGFVFVGGELRGQLTFAGTTHATDELEPVTGFVTRLCPGHAPVWLSVVEGQGELSLTDVAATPEGDVVVAGRFYEDVFVSSSSPAATSAHDGADLYVASLSADLGLSTWAVALAVVAADGARVAVDGDGGIFVSALFYQHADGSLPAGVHEGEAPDRHLVARIDPDGEDGWLTSFDAALVRHMGGPGPFIDTAVGQLYVAGAILETTTFATEQVVEGDDTSFQGWLARFAVNMPTLWGVEPIAGAGDQRITGLATDEAGRAWLIGQHGGEVAVDFDERSVEGAGAFVLRRPPGPGY